MIALANRAFADVRGFNYIPSYAANVWEIVDRFDPEVWDRELGYAKRLGSNTLRVWTDVLSFQRDEAHFLSVWRQAFAIAKRHELRLIVALANRWVDPQWPFGGIDLTPVLSGAPSEEYRRYVTTFVSAFRDEPGVLLWDLCNEPFHSLLAPQLSLDSPAEADPRVEAGPAAALVQERELGFWRGVAETVREARPSQPLTIALQRGHPFDHDAVDDMVDVLSAHLYHGAVEGDEAFGRVCDTVVAVANERGKPLIASEMCPGSKDAETRREIIRVSVRQADRRGMGWQLWQLVAGKIVSSRLDRVDHTCAPGDEALMYFVERDGTPRPGHDPSEWRT